MGGVEQYLGPDISKKSGSSQLAKKPHATHLDELCVPSNIL
jgi:hypothetical protein